MGSANIEYTADVAKVVQAMDRIIQKQVKVRAGAKGVAVDGKKAGDETAKGAQKGTEKLSSMEKMTNKVTMGMGAYIKGAIGIAGVARAWSFVNAEIRKVAEAQSMLAVTGKEYNRVSLQLANQMGQARTNVGQRLSADVLESIQKAGRFGADFEKGKTVGIGAHVAFGVKGQLLAGEALEIAKLTAGFAGYKTVDPQEIGGIFKVLKQAGVTTKIGAARRMKQLGETYEAALSMDLSANIGGIVRFIGEYVKQGGTYEMGLARFEQAITGTGSEQEAAQRSRQMVMIMRGEKMQKTLAKRMGITAKEFQELPMDVRMEEFGRFAGGAGEAELTKAGVATRRLGWVIGLYGKGGFGAIQKGKERLKGATGQQMIEELEDWGTTLQAREMVAETEAALLNARISRWTTMGETKMNVYRAMHRRAIAGEEELPYFRQRKGDLVDWAYGEKGEQELVAYGAMKERFGKIRGVAREQKWTYRQPLGMGTGYEWRYAGTPEGQLYREAAKYMGDIKPHVGDPLEPREVGKMEEYLILLEGMIDELRKNTDATKENSVEKGNLRERGRFGMVLNLGANVE